MPMNHVDGSAHFELHFIINLKCYVHTMRPYKNQTHSADTPPSRTIKATFNMHITAHRVHITPSRCCTPAESRLDRELYGEKNTFYAK